MTTTETAPYPHPTLYPENQRQSRTLHPNRAARMGLRSRLRQLQPARRVPPLLAAPIQLASTTRQLEIPNTHPIPEYPAEQRGGFTQLAQCFRLVTSKAERIGRPISESTDKGATTRSNQESGAGLTAFLSVVLVSHFGVRPLQPSTFLQWIPASARAEATGLYSPGLLKHVYAQTSEVSSCFGREGIETPGSGV